MMTDHQGGDPPSEERAHRINDPGFAAEIWFPRGESIGTAGAGGLEAFASGDGIGSPERSRTAFTSRPRVEALTNGADR